MIRKNKYSILVALILLYLSLTNSENFQRVDLKGFTNIDKLVHFGMYFVLMSVIIFEHRKNLKKPVNLFFLALIPLTFGILMEILQLLLTSTRSGDIYDALADAAGIIACILIWFLIKPQVKETVR